MVNTIMVEIPPDMDPTRTSIPRRSAVMVPPRPVPASHSYESMASCYQRRELPVPRPAIKHFTKTATPYLLYDRQDCRPEFGRRPNEGETQTGYEDRDEARRFRFRGSVKGK